MKRIFFELALVMLLPFLMNAMPREELSLDGTWLFTLQPGSESAFKEFAPRYVRVPHTWNTDDSLYSYKGKVLYERKVNIPAKWKGKRIRIYFDAVYHDAHVYVNGVKAGEHLGSGYTGFSFDVTKLIRTGRENSISVSADNSYSDFNFPYKNHFDWNNDGGIIRPVKLVATGASSVRYAWVRQKTDVGKKKAEINLEIRNWENTGKKCNYKILIKDNSDKSVVFEKYYTGVPQSNGSYHITFTLDNIKLWHFDYPNLYSLEVIPDIKGKATDHYATTFGLRNIEIKGDKFYLNGEPVRLPGIEYMPGSHPSYGMAEGDDVIGMAVDRMKEVNSLITRCHWQYDKRYLDLLDSKGVLVQVELPWWQAPGNLTPELETLAKDQISEMVEQYFNHPSIFAWGVSNEMYYNTDRDIYRRLIDYTNNIGSGKMVSVVSNEIFNRLENDESLLADIPTWNDYVGTWHGNSRDETPGMLGNINEKALKGRPLLITEHGLCEPLFTGGDARRITEMAYHYDQWAKHPFIFGAIYFSLNDYRTHAGENGEGRYKARVHGLTSLWFDKKPSFEVYKSLASPLYVETCDQTPDGKSVHLKMVVKDNLPSYTLRGYRMEWTASDGKHDIVLPDLKPGEKYEVTLKGMNSGDKPCIKVYRPNGYVAMEY